MAAGPPRGELGVGLAASCAGKLDGSRSPEQTALQERLSRADSLSRGMAQTSKQHPFVCLKILPTLVLKRNYQCHRHSDLSHPTLLAFFSPGPMCGTAGRGEAKLLQEGTLTTPKLTSETNPQVGLRREGKAFLAALGKHFPLQAPRAVRKPTLEH